MAEVAFGDTALHTATDAIDKIHTTAESSCIMVAESWERVWMDPIEAGVGWRRAHHPHPGN